MVVANALNVSLARFLLSLLLAMTTCGQKELSRALRYIASCVVVATPYTI